MTARDRALERFRGHFGAEPTLLARAPGRVNLIGEHTDYNDGFVLPMAIDRDTCVAVRPRDDGRVVVVADGFAGEVTFGLDRVRRGPAAWGRYVEGMVWSLAQAGHDLRGWEGAVASDVPVGAGLSSSAALEVATARACCAIADIPWDPVAMAQLAQQAENDWVGVDCGIMDQMAVSAGRAGHALLLDCRSLGIDPVPLPPDTAVVVLDTMTRRELSDSAYNDRREECRRASRQLGVAALRDLTVDELPRPDGADGDLLHRRARHVVTENQRTRAAAEALRSGDAALVGRLMTDSHRSLRDDFEVSTPALDLLAEAAAAVDGCLGARMTGGGFGGCVVALTDAPGAAAVAREATAAYHAATGRRPDVHVCSASDGVTCSSV